MSKDCIWFAENHPKSKASYFDVEYCANNLGKELIRDNRHTSVKVFFF